MTVATRDDCRRDAAELKRNVAQSQRNWAALRGVTVDAADRSADLEANLFRALSQATRTELLASLPGLLGDGEKAGAMSALCSTAALVHNIFEYWRDRPNSPIERACGCAPSEDALELRFAARPPSASGAQPRSSPADVVLENRSPRTVIAASFLEPYARVDNHPSADFLDADLDWSDLQACRNLALDLRSNPNRFRHLAVARLLELGQSWTRASDPRGFRLLYLWYDGGGPAADRVRVEIDRFRMRAGGELRFEARSWQEVFCDLRCALTPDSGDARDAAYLQYIGDRYFRENPSA